MKNGILYADDNGEVGEEVGKLTDANLIKRKVINVFGFYYYY